MEDFKVVCGVNSYVFYKEVMGLGFFRNDVVFMEFLVVDSGRVYSGLGLFKGLGDVSRLCIGK